MQDNLTCKNNHLCPFLSFSMLTSLLKSIYTDIRVAPCLYYTGTRISVSFWNENLNKLIHKWLVSNNFTLVSCDNRDELVLEQNSFRYHVKGPKEFLFPEHHALLSCQNTINFNSVEATTRFELLRCHWNNDRWPQKQHIVILWIQNKQKSSHRVNIHLCWYQLLRD